MRLLFPLILAACGSPYCGEALRVGLDASTITPFCSGDELQVQGSPGSYGIPLGMEIDEDASAGVLVAIRLTPEGGSSQDAVGNLPAFEDGGMWTTNTMFTLQTQTEAEMAELDGSTAQFSVTATVGEVTLETILEDMTVQAP